jgi:predicted RNA-binding protein YlxR (DUF448 family)
MSLSNDPAGPIRTCVGCRAKRPQAELVRCVLDADGVAHVDRPRAGRQGRSGRGGRGAWLCGIECLEPAMRRGGFERAWKTGARIPAAALAPLGRELSGTN